MSVTLRQLEYVVALADTLSFRVAAERCFVTQPALSAQLRELERALGIALFERDRRHVAPTGAGARFVARARRILAEVEELQDEATGGGRPLSGSLRLGVIPTVAPYVLPRIVPVLRRRFPELRLLLREDHTARLVELLERGELDVLLVALESDLGRAETLPLFRDPFVLAAPADHALAARRSILPRDLEGAELLLLDEGH